MKIVKTVVFVLFGLMFINAGANKFFFYMPIPPMDEHAQKVFDALMTLKWITPLTGIVEVVAGGLVLFPKTRALGAIMLLPILVGIICHHLVLMPDGLIIAAVLFVIELWMIADNWKKYQPIIG